MGTASASFTFYLNDIEPLPLAEELLRCFESRFLQAKSMEFRLPGTRLLEKLEGSIDGNLFWVRDALPTRLPGEELLDGTEFTTLQNSAEGLSVPGDLPRIMKRLRTLSEESSELWKTKQIPDDDAYCTFWGLCRIVQPCDNQCLREVHVLRQRLFQTEHLEPVLRVICHLTHHPRPYLMMTLLTHSFVWSRYTSIFDAANKDWVAKSNLLAEAENARRLAETMSNYVRRFPDAKIEWEMERQHRPDVSGFLPSEFEARLGPPNCPKKVRDLPTIQ